jgi:hypothetical protein
VGPLHLGRLAKTAMTATPTMTGSNGAGANSCKS